MTKKRVTSITVRKGSDIQIFKATNLKNKTRFIEGYSDEEFIINSTDYEIVYKEALKEVKERYPKYNIQVLSSTVKTK